MTRKRPDPKSCISGTIIFFSVYLSTRVEIIKYHYYALKTGHFLNQTNHSNHF